MTEGILTAEEHAAYLDKCLSRIWQMGAELNMDELQDLSVAARAHCAALWEMDIQLEASELPDELDMTTVN